MIWPPDSQNSFKKLDCQTFSQENPIDKPELQNEKLLSHEQESLLKLYAIRVN